MCTFKSPHTHTTRWTIPVSPPNLDFHHWLGTREGLPPTPQALSPVQDLVLGFSPSQAASQKPKRQAVWMALHQGIFTLPLASLAHTDLADGPAKETTPWCCLNIMDLEAAQLKHKPKQKRTSIGRYAPWNRFPVA